MPVGRGVCGFAANSTRSSKKWLVHFFDSLREPEGFLPPAPCLFAFFMGIPRPALHGAGMQGQASDILLHANEILRLKDRLNELMAFHTGKTKDQLAKDTDRDNFLSAEEAKTYGLVDQVLASLPKK